MKKIITVKTVKELKEILGSIDENMPIFLTGSLSSEMQLFVHEIAGKKYLVINNYSIPT